MVRQASLWDAFPGRHSHPHLVLASNHGHVGMRALICGHGLSPWQCVLLSRRDSSPNRMIGITGPDYSLEQVSGDSVRDVVDWGSIFATNSFLESMPEQVDVADVKEPSWLEQP
ncbi:hypothetical protein AMC87_CH02700 [Rhizobium phaseoli]|nr:hypothetical protein AMC87_CH02700 [Rhizobium phaseoli]